MVQQIVAGSGGGSVLLPGEEFQILASLANSPLAPTWMDLPQYDAGGNWIINRNGVPSDTGMPHGVPDTARLDYSTAEQNTGQKWIDGNDIYQITIEGNTGTTVNDFVVIFNIANFGELVGISGHINNPVGSQVPSGFYNSQSGTVFNLTVTTAGSVESFHAGASFSNLPIICTVLYTKTTG